MQCSKEKWVPIIYLRTSTYQQVKVGLGLVLSSSLKPLLGRRFTQLKTSLCVISNTNKATHNQDITTSGL